MLEKAKAYVDVLVTNKEREEYLTALRRIRKIKDLNQRTKEYKKLCQTHNSL